MLWGLFNALSRLCGAPSLGRQHGALGFEYFYPQKWFRYEGRRGLSCVRPSVWICNSSRRGGKRKTVRGAFGVGAVEAAALLAVAVRGHCQPVGCQPA